jgi:hypothetical protein
LFMRIRNTLIKIGFEQCLAKVRARPVRISSREAILRLAMAAKSV